MPARHDEQRWELPRTRGAAAEARGHVASYRDRLGEDAWQRVRLLVSELATNAVRHGSGRIELSVLAVGPGLRVCVHDEGDGRPTPRTPGDDGGFGLHLVEDFSDRWGVEADGASVWFEVDVPAD